MHSQEEDHWGNRATLPKVKSLGKYRFLYHGCYHGNYGI